MEELIQSPKVKTVCVIVAGGKGLRLGGGEPKQFLHLDGKPLISYSFRYFANHPAIDEIVVVVPQGFESKILEILNAEITDKPWSITTGGNRRQDSVLAGLKAAGECDIAVIQDGARPFPPDGLDEALALITTRTGVIYAVPVTDSVKAVDSNGVIIRTVPRDGLWGAQTPQIFHKTELIDALTWCDDNKLVVTDDASAFENRGWQVKIVQGSINNIKVTYSEDFKRAEQLLKDCRDAR